ncbi:hypothetical protein EI982_13790 [Haloplanus rallus]|jgi:hypothetical protein|uniref:Uncharacterized protein n=1 Tax=Haloplanus rallus TaxID=1816183 RepID=A0A6B9FF97_9EURY|nr:MULTISPECIES: hypothetical protein [Haloplanus]QGX95780.1 hypothetical protein EI982_13790 [Haloplanus rallus]
MSSATTDHDLLPSVESPVDAVDSLCSVGAALGIVTYGVGLLVGDVGAATTGVGLGVVSVFGALGARSARTAVDAL